MIQELNNKKKFIKVTPEEGQFLYNGEVITESIFTPENADLSKWQEISASEAKKIQRQQALEEEKEEE